MSLLDTLTSAFINTFGITQPSETARRQATWFIGGLLLLAVAGAIAAACVLFQVIHH